MTSRLVTVCCAVTFALAASTAFAADGVLLVQKTTNGTISTESQIQIEKTRMRTEVTVGDQTQILIFDGVKQVAYVVTPATKSYIEMTKAELEQMAVMVKGLMAQLEKMPPAQREQMSSMMGARGMSLTPVSTTYKRNGSDKVGKWSCDKYDGYRNDQKVSEVCTTTPAALGLTAADFAVTQQLAEFMSTVLPQAGDQVSFLGQGEAGGYSGFPLKSTVTAAGRTVTAEVTAVSRQTFSDSLFEVPAGFTKQTMMGGRGR
jgi:hypothetical protein